MRTRKLRRTSAATAAVALALLAGSADAQRAEPLAQQGAADAPARASSDSQPLNKKAWRQLAEPAKAGWDAEGLAGARKVAEEAGSAAVFAVHRGRVVLAWGEVKRRFKCHSVRKSIASALLGMAVAGKRIDLDEALSTLEIDDLEPLSKVEKAARVRDLMCARSGIYHPAAKEPAGMKRSRPKRFSKKPGEAFFYNNWDFNTLAAIFEKRCGLGLVEAFDRWLARPLGMEDYRPQDGSYELEPGNSRHPAYAFRISARDLARFGMLFARDGRVAERRVLSKAWIKESTSAHSDLGAGRGYGYMWWLYRAGSLAKQPSLNSVDSFAAHGTGGQFVLVVPSRDFVLVHRGDTDNGRRVPGSAVWKIAESIFAAMPAAVVKGAEQSGASSGL